MLIEPLNKKIDAVVEAPGSKSITNRAFVIAALADGATELKNTLECDDTRCMREALQSFGIEIEGRGTVTVKGGCGKITLPSAPVFVGNSGTTMRFLMAFAGLVNGKVILQGDERMKERPVDDLFGPLRQMEVEAKKNSAGDVEISSEGFIKGGEVEMSGLMSSQFFSSLMLCGPYMQEDLFLKATSPIQSKPYIYITEKIMNDFGAKAVALADAGGFKVTAGQGYKARQYTIEGDSSNASYLWAAAAITNGRVKVKNISPKSEQGDIGIVGILEKMGCRIERGEDSVTIIGGDLRGIEVDMNDMPDMVQTLAVVALFAKGKTVIKNVPNLRYKETDRIDNLAIELRRVGGCVEEHADGLIIDGDKTALRFAEVETYNDHRMAMSLSLIGLVSPIEIKNPECVSKTFPEYFEVFNNKIRGKI